jgi:chromosome segregation ATPase
VRYLAEVQKKSSGVFGGGKAELKLLACQQGEQTWVSVEEQKPNSVVAEEANSYNSGALVLVELTPKQRVQQIQPAGRSITSILQTLSRAYAKLQSEQEEIEQFKPALSYQDEEFGKRRQELERQEAEIEAKWQELAPNREQADTEDAERLEAQRNEVESIRSEAERMRAELDRSHQDLDREWERYRQEAARLEQSQSASVIDDRQVGEIDEQLAGLSDLAIAIDPVRTPLDAVLETMTALKAWLEEGQTALGQDRDRAEQLHCVVDEQQQQLDGDWQQWHEARAALEQLQVEVQLEQAKLSADREYADVLRGYISDREAAHQQMLQLAQTFGNGNEASANVDVERLQQMPIQQLQATVRDLQQDLDKVFQFVNDQEEELRLQQETLDELNSKLENASAADKGQIESELADERDRYQMLEQTLIGQRRTFRERQAGLRQHQAILWQRLGHSPEGEAKNPERSTAIAPLLEQLESDAQNLRDELQRLDRQIAEREQSLESKQQELGEQETQHQAGREELDGRKRDWLDRYAEVAGVRGRIQAREEILSPLQEGLFEMRQYLEGIAEQLNDLQASGDYQRETIPQLREVVAELSAESAA